MSAQAHPTATRVIRVHVIQRPATATQLESPTRDSRSRLTVSVAVRLGVGLGVRVGPDPQPDPTNHPTPQFTRPTSNRAAVVTDPFRGSPRWEKSLWESRMASDLLLRSQAGLTDRDHTLLGWLADHGVLTSFQIAHALYPSLDFAQRRLRTLTQRDILGRFRPQKPDGGSYPYHYVLDQLGVDIVASQRGDDTPRRDQARRTLAPHQPYQPAPPAGHQPVLHRPRRPRPLPPRHPTDSMVVGSALPTGRRARRTR